MKYINAYSSVSALGNNNNSIVNALRHPEGNYLTKRNDLLLNGKESFFGIINADLPDISKYETFNTRNNQVIAYCVEQIRDKVDYFLNKYPKDRIAVVMGTSTSGLNETEKEISRRYKNLPKQNEYFFCFQEFGAPSMFLCKYLNIDGPCYTISTACSSSVRALISTKRLLDSDLADVVIAGGADTLCTVPINGFDSMQVLSKNRCMPFCRDRSGINIGEAGGIMILSKEPASLSIAGIGESSDAYHVSSPDPSGDGAVTCMKMALEEAKLSVNDIGYINLHGTATKLNDEMESKAVSRIFGNNTPCSSTKYMTGHTLGAAGILESCILCYLLDNKINLPVQDTSLSELDDTLCDCGLIKDSKSTTKRFMMSNSFAFGGNNASVIIGKE